MITNEEEKTDQKSSRRVRIKPIPKNLIEKWPDVVTCLITLSNGKQILMVR